MQKKNENPISAEPSVEDIEQMDYYDFMGYMEVPFFMVGGLESSERLAQLCDIKPNMRVLFIGCGTGESALNYVRKFDVNVAGIDIAEKMIEEANKRVHQEGLENKAEFKAGDAYDLDFPDKSFDIVISEFVSQFLDCSRAFPEFHRVLKPNGRLGINEMFKLDDIPPDAEKTVNEAEQIFRELTNLPFTLYSLEKWKQYFTDNGFIDLQSEEQLEIGSAISSREMIHDMGGWKGIFKMLGKMIKLMLKSKKIRKKFGMISKAKRRLISNRTTKKYVGYLLLSGRRK
ncbi:MAG: methyltransferase domain-containing protein [Candidatus Lokiarchaeota archaeon]|nr:methyltransferase domain-containing protein [Candidatus Lokiarchaeota archaeon]